MAIERDRLETWWAGLSGGERAAAKRSREGELDEATRASLEDAGVIESGDTSGDDEVRTFLKTRH